MTFEKVNKNERKRNRSMCLLLLLLLKIVKIKLYSIDPLNKWNEIEREKTKYLFSWLELRKKTFFFNK
jgi:hypothetical protein